MLLKVFYQQIVLPINSKSEHLGLNWEITDQRIEGFRSYSQNGSIKTKEKMHYYIIEDTQ